MSKRGSLTAQFVRLLLGAGIACCILFLALRTAQDFGITYYDLHSDFRQRETNRRIEQFQAYVTE